MHLRVFERVSEIVLPEPCFGWILCFKKEEFRVRKLVFLTMGEKREKNKPVLRLSNERTKAVEKRGEKRDSRRVCFFCFCAPKHTSTLRASGILFALLLLFFPQHIKAFTLCAHDERSQ